MNIFKKIKIKRQENSQSFSQTSNESEKDSFLDLRDGKKYKTVKIGNQLWMAENLNFDAGDGCWSYNNASSNAKIYGRLYNWETAKQSAPPDWHLPTDEEWKELEIYLGMSPDDAGKKVDRGIDANVGGKLKSISSWKKPNHGATNESGFNALPGGSRSYYENAFYNAGEQAYFWTSTPGGITTACFRCLEYSSGKISRGDSIGRSTGFSVRCVKIFSPDTFSKLSEERKDTDVRSDLAIEHDEEGQPASSLSTVVDSLVDELINIGQTEGFVSDYGYHPVKHPRAREIGEILDEKFGFEMMQTVHSKVSAKLGPSIAQDLEFVWNGIGIWEI